MFKWLWRLSVLISLSITLLVWLVISAGIVWGIGSWYKSQQGDQATIWGTIWSNKQAEKLGLDPTEDLDRLLAQIPFKRLQLMSYWDEIEADEGNYDFASLERQFAITKSRNVGISLQLGLHQSRLPKCHQPAWANNLSPPEFKDRLKKYLLKVVERFDTEANLVQYQLEPEIFEAESEFCPQMLNGDDLSELYAYLKTLTIKEISVSRPNNLAVWRQQNPNPDGFGLKITPHANRSGWLQKAYQRTLPTHYYSFLAGNLKMLHSESRIFIRDLNTEHGDLEEALSNPQTFSQNPNLKTETLKSRLEYARQTGIKTIYLRGAEWWLQQKDSGGGDPWEIIRETVQADF